VIEPLESTFDLASRASAGDRKAVDRLLRRYLPVLTRWAHRRLPDSARDLSDTGDIVQAAMMRGVSSLNGLSLERPGTFFAYLRVIVLNLITDELRRSGRHPTHGEVPEDLKSDAPEPFDNVLSWERREAYDRAMADLSEEYQEVIMMRLELGLPHAQIAELVGCPTANAARMKVSRALLALAERLEQHDGD
jgi:RNA polymerase sigma factor (sigma-70 family)